MELGIIPGVAFSSDFVFAFLSIVLIDIILAGDNAVVIAMAVRSLDPKQRRQGILLGSAGAVVLRVILTFFAAKLLALPFVKLCGGVLIIWVAMKLFMEGSDEGKFKREVKTLRQAVVTIMVADLVMSTDNVLAVAGASKGNLALLLFGLGLSIPFVVLTSNLLTKLMDRFPVIVFVGAAILGRVAAEMITTDPYFQRFLHLSRVSEYLIQASFAIGIILAAKAWQRFRPAKVPVVAQSADGGPFYLASWDLR
jgi:YjbE family integral membrane protein